MLELLISPVREVHAISMDPSIGNFDQAEVEEADIPDICHLFSTDTIFG